MGCPAPAPAPEFEPEPDPETPSSSPSPIAELKPEPEPASPETWLIRLDALRDTTFSRLFFFQLSSETYSSAPAHERFAWGGDGAATTWLPRTCSPTAPHGIHLRRNLYAASGTDAPFRVAMNGDPPWPSPIALCGPNPPGLCSLSQSAGDAPWWFAFEETADGPKVIEDPRSPKVVGDRGFVIRSYSARLGGVQRASPSFSVR